MICSINRIILITITNMDNSDLYKVWYVIMRALEYGPLKKDILHLDQIIERDIAHHHIKYKNSKFYIKIIKRL